MCLGRIFRREVLTIRFLTSGESHGKCLNAIIEGIGYGYELDFDFINNELKKRQQGAGRGNRMKIETDVIEIKSGVRFSKTTGSPICLEIKNRDFENWKIPMSVEKFDFDGLDDVQKNEILEKIKEKKITKVRPGHADYSGAIKFGADDIRDILERSSARETATRVAVGAICQDILKKFGIYGEFEILSVCGADNEKDISEKIEKAKADGVSLGGIVKVKFTGLPIGLGSFVHWDKRLDGLLAQSMMSIPAIKSVEIGMGKDVCFNTGDKVHDEFYIIDNKITRKTNNAGGIEGGMTNGEPLLITVGMKPIPTMRKPLNSVDIENRTETKAHFERADTSAVYAMGVVALNMASIVLLNAFLDKFGGDSYNETLRNYNAR